LQFVLDHLPLLNSEKMLIVENRIFAISTNQSTSLTSSISIYIDTHEFNQDRLNRRTISLPENLERSVTKNRKRLNVKEAIIDEIDQERGEFKKLPDVVASSHLGKVFLVENICAAIQSLKSLFVTFFFTSF